MISHVVGNWNRNQNDCHNQTPLERERTAEEYRRVVREGSKYVCSLPLNSCRDLCNLKNIWPINHRAFRRHGNTGRLQLGGRIDAFKYDEKLVKEVRPLLNDYSSDFQYCSSDPITKLQDW